MGGYRRFVSYIYGYAQGERRENFGFVKINARDRECKIWIHVRGFYTRNQQPYPVYLFKQSREKLQGILLGELESRNGALEWNGVLDADNLMDSGVTLDETRGVYIGNADRIFAAEWDDYPVDVERFEPLKGSARQETEKPDGEKEEKAEPETLGIEQVREKEPEGEREQDSVKPEDSPQAEAAEQGESEPEPPGWESLQEGRLRGEEVPEKEVSEKEALCKDPRWEQWKYLSEHFPVTCYVKNEDAALCGIRLEPGALARIPRNKWRMGNNSFLLHGLYQYRHILLLRKQMQEEAQYQLGVPGVFNEQEQMMASMFGFEEFKVMKGPEAGTGSFGYWCRTLG